MQVQATRKEKKIKRHQAQKQGDVRGQYLAARCVLGCPIRYRGESALRQSSWINVKTRHTPGQCPESCTLTQTTAAVKTSLLVLPLHSKSPSLAGNSRSNCASLCPSTAAYPWHPPCWQPIYTGQPANEEQGTLGCAGHRWWLVLLAAGTLQPDLSRPLWCS